MAMWMDRGRIIVSRSVWDTARHRLVQKRVSVQSEADARFLDQWLQSRLKTRPDLAYAKPAEIRVAAGLPEKLRRREAYG